jgi:hypothetical protein
MAEEEKTTTEEESKETSADDGKKTDDSKAGAETQAAKTEAAKVDITQTPEFKTALENAIRAKMPQLHKQARKEIAKEVSGEKEGQPTAEELKTRAETAETELRRFRARDQVEAYIADKRNGVTVRNTRALVRFIEHDFEFDDEGKVVNLKDLVTQAKVEAPELFGVITGSADGGVGARSSGSPDMNTLIRQRAGYGA